MNDQIIGTIRTLVQMLVGWITTQAFIRWGIEVDSAAFELLLFGFFTGVYRLAVTALARRWPVLEWLNGWAAAPDYRTADS